MARFALPNTRRYCLANATVPAACLGEGKADVVGLTQTDILIADGRVERIGRVDRAPELPVLDLERSMVWPAFADMHTHLDKGHISPRKANPDGTFASALLATKTDREAHWNASDVRRRMDFAL